MTAPQPAVRYTTHCLYCPKTFDVPNLAVPNNKPVEQRAFELVKILAAHVEKKHRAQWERLMAAHSVEIAALFTHEDPVFIALVQKVKDLLQEPVKT